MKNRLIYLFLSIFVFSTVAFAQTPDGVGFTVLKGTNVVFEWSALSGGWTDSDFQYRVNAGAWVTSTAVGASTISIDLSGNLDGDLIEWQVQDTDLTPAWGATYSFTLGEPVPTPTDAAVGINISTTSVSWTDFEEGGSASLGAFFDFLFDNDNNPGNGGLEPQQDGLSLTNATFVTVLNPNTTYYWHVRVSDIDAVTGGNQAGTWITFSFTTNSGTPTLVSPANNADSINPAGVTLTWAAVTGATHYRVTVTGSGAGGPYIVAAPAVSYTYGVSLAVGEIYTWTVESSNVGAGGPWSTASAAWTFTTNFLTSPAHLESGVTITPNFTWTAPTTGTAPYDLEIATDAAFANIVFTELGINATNFQLPLAFRLDNATIYYWRITSTGGAIASSRFSTIFEAKPALVSPAHLSSIVGNTIQFQWTLPAGSLKYVVELDDNPDFLSQVTGFPTSSTTLNFFNHPYTLATLPSNNYYWRVKAYTETDVLVSVSSTWRFTISGPPTAVPAYPINLTTVYSNSPIIYWFLNDYFYNQGVYYRVQYGTTQGGPYAGGTSPITTNNWVPLPGLTIGQTYYYVIEASQDAGFGSFTTSEEGSFVVFYSAIASIPVYQSFPLGNTVYSLTPTLYWFLGVHVPGVAFDVQVNDGTDFTSNLPLEVDATGVSAYQLETPTLNAGTSYIWRVRITGSTAWYGPETFFVDPSATNAPSVLDANIPTPSSPIGGVVVATQSPLLTWINSTTNILEYQVIYSSDPTLDINGVLVNVAPPNDASGGTSGWLVTNSYSLSGLTQGATYYWQVKSRLASPPNTESNFSSVAQFTVAPGANPIVVLPANPIVGSTITTNAATLSWVVPARSESALTYDLEISKNKDMASALLINNLEQPNYEVKNLELNSNYYWRVRSKTSDGAVSEYSYKGEFNTGSVTSVGKDEELPSEFNLAQNFPNPFNPTTKISYTLPSNSFVSLKIYDMLGREVKTLLNQDMNAGVYSVDWNGVDNFGNKVASGTYIYRIVAGNFTLSKKMVLLK